MVAFDDECGGRCRWSWVEGKAGGGAPSRTFRRPRAGPPPGPACSGLRPAPGAGYDWPTPSEADCLPDWAALRGPPSLGTPMPTPPTRPPPRTAVVVRVPHDVLREDSVPRWLLLLA